MERINKQQENNTIEEIIKNLALSFKTFGFDNTGYSYRFMNTLGNMLVKGVDEGKTYIKNYLELSGYELTEIYSLLENIEFNKLLKDLSDFLTPPIKKMNTNFTIIYGKDIIIPDSMESITINIDDHIVPYLNIKLNPSQEYRNIFPESCDISDKLLNAINKGGTIIFNIKDLSREDAAMICILSLRKQIYIAPYTNNPLQINKDLNIICVIHPCVFSAKGLCDYASKIIYTKGATIIDSLISQKD